MKGASSLKTTPKGRVLKRYPDAYAYRDPDSEYWSIFVDHPSAGAFAEGITAQDAWANAEKQL